MRFLYEGFCCTIAAAFSYRKKVNVYNCNKDVGRLPFQLLLPQGYHWVRLPQLSLVLRALRKKTLAKEMIRYRRSESRETIKEDIKGRLL